jgi:hypothetical protein
VIAHVTLADGAPGYQLARLADMGRAIKTEVNKRFGAAPLKVAADWRALLEQAHITR